MYIDFNGNNGGSGGGMTPQQVQSMINASISGMQITFSGTTETTATTGHNGDFYLKQPSTVTKQITTQDCHIYEEGGSLQYKAVDGATYTFTPNTDFSLQVEGSEYAMDFDYFVYENGEYNQLGIRFLYGDLNYDPEGEEPWMPGWYYAGDITDWEWVSWTSVTLTVYTRPAGEDSPAEPSVLSFGEDGWVEDFSTIMETSTDTEVGTYVMVDNKWNRPVVSDTITNIKTIDEISFIFLENKDPKTLYNIIESSDFAAVNSDSFDWDGDNTEPQTLKIAVTKTGVGLRIQGDDFDYFDYTGTTGSLATGLTEIQIAPKAEYNETNYPTEWAQGVNLEGYFEIVYGSNTIYVTLIQYYNGGGN